MNDTFNIINIEIDIEKIISSMFDKKKKSCPPDVRDFNKYHSKETIEYLRPHAELKKVVCTYAEEDVTEKMIEEFDRLKDLQIIGFKTGNWTYGEDWCCKTFISYDLLDLLMEIYAQTNQNNRPKR